MVAAEILEDGIEVSLPDRFLIREDEVDVAPVLRRGDLQNGASPEGGAQRPLVMLEEGEVDAVIVHLREILLDDRLYGLVCPPASRALEVGELDDVDLCGLVAALDGGADVECVAERLAGIDLQIAARADDEEARGAVDEPVIREGAEFRVLHHRHGAQAVREWKAATGDVDLRLQ